MDQYHTYRVSMMREGSGTQRSQDDVVVQAKNEFDARRQAEQMHPGYKAVNAYKVD